MLMVAADPLNVRSLLPILLPSLLPILVPFLGLWSRFGNFFGGFFKQCLGVVGYGLLRFMLMVAALTIFSTCAFCFLSFRVLPVGLGGRVLREPFCLLADCCDPELFRGVLPRS